MVRARLWGPLGQTDDLRLVLDTGASLTLIVPELLDGPGYNPRDGSFQPSEEEAAACAALR